MKKEDKQTFKQAVMASTIGFQVAFAPFIGIAIGIFLDWKFNTYPYLTLIWMLIGVAAAGLNYYRFAKQQQDEDKGQKK
ncbi:MAG: AtpZ/AtpI family protein [Syntrophobacteraceae bacterium]|nr:AtpZ/AtpI family protein [Syntrophobacteraceae bacterium]